MAAIGIDFPGTVMENQIRYEGFWIIQTTYRSVSPLSPNQCTQIGCQACLAYRWNVLTTKGIYSYEEVICLFVCYCVPVTTSLWVGMEAGTSAPSTNFMLPVYVPAQRWDEAACLHPRLVMWHCFCAFLFSTDMMLLGRGWAWWGNSSRAPTPTPTPGW